MARRKKNTHPLSIVLIILIAAIIFATGYIIKLCFDLVTMDSDGKPASSQSAKPTKPGKETEPEPTDEPQPDLPVASATVGSIGDLLMHAGVIKAGKVDKDTYDFSTIFQYLDDYTLPLDYAVANLETTFAGTAFPYQGYPAHNCPDQLADDAKAAGFDMFLTANNHCCDTKMAGVDRTLEQTRQRGLATLGTRLSGDEDRYTIVDVNGIKIGMICYTYAMGRDGKGLCMNGSTTYVEKPAQINYFLDQELDAFYSEIQQSYDAMLQEGAETTILFIHWGEEYKTAENGTQHAIAQKMCDMGFDVIIGGHPHVVQPMDLLTSNADPSHKTVCLYSMGNAVSNQRIAEMSLKTGHTEDGMLFTVSFDKYADGSVYVSAADVLPTWVDLRTTEDGNEYIILPLDSSRQASWKMLFGLTDETTQCANDSYNRTMELVRSGLQKVNSYLTQQKEQREMLPAA